MTACREKPDTIGQFDPSFDPSFTCSIPHIVAYDVIRQFEKAIKGSLNHDLGNILDTKQLRMIQYFIDALKASAKRSELHNDTFVKTDFTVQPWDTKECNLKLPLEPPSTKTEATTEATTEQTSSMSSMSSTSSSINCNENITNYNSTESLSYNDQTHVLVSTATILSVLVLCSGYTPTLPRPEKVRVLGTCNFQHELF
jgi:hypothetical protein